MLLNDIQIAPKAKTKMAVAFLLIIALTLCIVAVYSKPILRRIKTRQQSCKLKALPVNAIGPAYPLIGHSYLFPTDAAKFWEFIKKVSDQVLEDPDLKTGTLWLGPTPMLLLFHPSAAEVVLRSSKHSTKVCIHAS